MVRSPRSPLVRMLAVSGALAFMLAACGEGGEPTEPPVQEQGAAPAEQTIAGNLATAPDATSQS